MDMMNFQLLPYITPCYSAVFVVACLCCSKLIISLSVDVASLCLLFSYQHCFFFSPLDNGRGRDCRRCWQHPWWPGAPSGSAVQTWSPRPRTRLRGPCRRGTKRRADVPLVYCNFDIPNSKKNSRVQWHFFLSSSLLYPDMKHLEFKP